MIRRLLTTCIAILFLSGCTHRAPLSVQIDYLSQENLASYIVGTPDPLINCPPIGERLIIQWALSKKYDCFEDRHIELTVRFRDNHEELIIVPVPERRGIYIFDVINDHYYETCGIATFKIDLIGSDYILCRWRHQLWEELIELDTIDENRSIDNAPALD